MKSKIATLCLFLAISLITTSIGNFAQAANYGRKKTRQKQRTPFQTTQDVIGILDKAIKAMKKNKLDKADNLIKQALLIHPNYLKSLGFQAFIEFQRNHFTKAISLAEQITEQDKANKLANMTIGLAKMKLGEHELAKEKFEYILTKYPDDWKSYFQLGIIERIKENYPLAIKHFKKCIRIKYDALGCYNEISTSYALNGQVDKAFKAARLILNREPYHVPSYVTLTDIVVRYNKHKTAAVALLKQGIAFNSTSQEIHMMLSRILTQLGRHQEAEKYRIIARKLHRQYSSNVETTAYYLKQDGKNHEALGKLKEILAENPDDTFANYHAATIYRKLADRDNCVKHYQRILTKESSHFLANQGLGLCFLRAKEMTKAQHYLEKSLQLRPKNVNACINLGIFYQINSNHSNAIKTLKLCKSLTHKKKLRKSIENRISALTN